MSSIMIGIGVGILGLLFGCFVCFLMAFSTVYDEIYGVGFFERLYLKMEWRIRYVMLCKKHGYKISCETCYKWDEEKQSYSYLCSDDCNPPYYCSWKERI